MRSRIVYRIKLLCFSPFGSSSQPPGQETVRVVAVDRKGCTFEHPNKKDFVCLDFTQSMTCFQVRRGRRELEAAARAREESVMDLEVIKKIALDYALHNYCL